MADRIHCPSCNRPRPNRDDYDAGPETFAAAWIAYMPCCNAACGGHWGANCYHCHDPSNYTLMARLVSRFTALGYANPYSTAGAIARWAKLRT